MSEAHMKQSSDTKIVNISEEIKENFSVNRSFENIASELLEEILGNLDPITLTAAKPVCYRWMEVSTHLQGTPNYWRDSCLKVIPPNSLIELIGQSIGRVYKVSATDRESGNTDWVDWQGVFVAWGRASKVGKWRSETFAFYSNTKNQVNVVTHVKVSGEFVVTGHSWGQCAVWHSSTPRGVKCPGMHYGGVTDMALLDLLHDPPYKSGMRHHALVSTGRDGIRVTVLLNYYSHQNQLDKTRETRVLTSTSATGSTAVSVLDNKMTVLSEVRSEDYVVSLWSLSPPPTETEVPDIVLLRRVRGPGENLMTARIWLSGPLRGIEKLVTVDSMWKARTGNWMEWSRSRKFTLVHPASEKLRSRVTILSVPRKNDSVDMVKQTFEEAGLGKYNMFHCLYDCQSSFSRAMVFHDDVYVILAEHNMFLSMDGIHYRHYNTFLYLHAEVTALTVYLEFLVIGTSTGWLYIYHIPSPCQILLVDLDNASWRSNVAAGRPITSLCLGDEGDRLVLAVGAGSRVYTIKWFSHLEKAGGRLLEAKGGGGLLEVKGGGGFLEGKDGGDLEGKDEGGLLVGNDEGGLMEGKDEGGLLEGKDEGGLLEGKDEGDLEGKDGGGLLVGKAEGGLLEGKDGGDLEGKDDGDLLEGKDGGGSVIWRVQEWFSPSEKVGDGLLEGKDGGDHLEGKDNQGGVLE